MDLRDVMLLGLLAVVVGAGAYWLYDASVGKPKRAKAAQLAEWGRLAAELGGELRDTGRFYQLRARVSGVDVVAEMSHVTTTDPIVARHMAEARPNEWRTLVHALPARRSGVCFIALASTRDLARTGAKPNASGLAYDPIGGTTREQLDALLGVELAPFVLPFARVSGRGAPVVYGGPTCITVERHGLHFRVDETRAAVRLAAAIAGRC